MEMINIFENYIMNKSYRKVLIFGGTTEGRGVAERLLAQGVPCTVSVATQYGEEVMEPHPLLKIHTGRLEQGAMAQLMREGLFCCVLDATHPHAQEVSAQIRAACEKTGLPCLRLQRETCVTVDSSTACHPSNDSYADREKPTGEKNTGEKAVCRCIFVNDVEEAGTYLAGQPGRVLVTTGSKELGRFVKALGDASRVTARVLPAEASLQACREAGLAGSQIFAMQGPFDTEMNCALIRHADASWLLTKETGAAGGYPEKLRAAQECRIGAVVIRTPAASSAPGMSPDEVIARALKYAGESESTEEVKSTDGSVSIGDPAGHDASEKTEIKNIELKNTEIEKTVIKAQETGRRSLFLVGTGVGAPEAGTQEAHEAIASADILFGARTVLDNLKNSWPEAAGKAVVPVYDARAILQYLQEHPRIRTAAVMYSGDSGFYSGASSMLALVEKRRGEAGDTSETGRDDFMDKLDIRVICGISCVSWFAARAGIPWQDWKILSSHGRFCNVIGEVRRHVRCFVLLSGAEDLRRTGALLLKAQQEGTLGLLRLIYGYELSRPGEEIRECSAAELTQVSREGLYVLFIENLLFQRFPVLPGLPDSAFLRGRAPMTSSEIRALSLCKLQPGPKPLIWDVGAGTGSVSVEAALACPGGRVWSIEYKKAALELLKENRDRFCLQNMEIVEGRAPEALKDLPVPTHVFIGGSGGEIGQILLEVFSKNPGARVVVNCITSETLAALQTALKRLPVQDVECIQVSVHREETLGNYHYLRGMNPVFIISFEGSGTWYAADHAAAEQ